MTEFYVSKSNLFEYWQYTQNYTQDNLPDWLKNDADLKIFQHDDKLIMLDTPEHTYEEVWYGDYVIKNIRYNYIDCIGDGEVVIQEHNISDRFIFYDNYLISKFDIIEAYKYYGDFDYDNIPSWGRQNIAKSFDGDKLYLLNTKGYRYDEVSPIQYICRYVIRKSSELFKKDTFNTNAYLKLNVEKGGCSYV